MWVAVLLLGLMVGVVVLALVEVRSWQAGRRIGPIRQMYWRIAGAGLSFVILLLMFIGRYLLRNVHPLTAISYWVGCLGLACVLFLLALWDMRETGRVLSEKRKELMNKFLEERKPPQP